MSCYIAIPSISDIDSSRFQRLGRWNNTSQLIHCAPNGTAKIIAPNDVRYDGLLIVSRPFLTEGKDGSVTNALFVSGEVLKSEIDGIFLHPGKTNSPGKTEIEHVLKGLSKELQCIADKTVAFTHSGERSYQVACLHTVWEWLASPPPKDGQPKTPASIPGFDFTSLKKDYERLKRFDSTDLLVELYVLAQGCVDNQVAETARPHFAKRLKEQLDQKESSWLKEDSVFCESVNTLLKCTGTMTADTIKPFLGKIRAFLEAPMD